MNTNEISNCQDYEVSSAQKRMYILNKVTGNNYVYNMFNIITVKFDLNPGYLQEIFCKLIDRHESLRTSFHMKGDKIIQRIHEKVKFKIEYAEIDSKSIHTECMRFIRPFDLASAPLIRVKILRTKEENFLIFDMHHIIADGASINILINELYQLHDKKELLPLAMQYKDYSEKQKLLERSDKLARHRKFWLEQFSGEILPLALPTDYPRAEVQQFTGDGLHFNVDSMLTQRIKAFCDENRVTMNIFLMTVYIILLHKLSCREDIIIGNPVNARRSPELANVIGMFVNTLPIRSYPKKNKKFLELLEEVKSTFLASLKYQDFTLDMLINEIQLPKDLSINPLFDAAFLFNSNIMLECDLSKKYYKTVFVKSDISIEITQSDKEINFILEYCTSLFTEKTCRRFGNLFISLLAQIVKDKDILIKDLSTIDEKEKNKVLYEWNRTERTYDKHETIIDLFEKRVEKEPDKVALSCLGEAISYSGLNRYVNQFAGYLRENGVGRDSIVGIMMEPSIDMVIAILAIIKAGGAYLPVEKNTPESRVKYILEDSSAGYLISDGDIFENTIIYNRSLYTKYKGENLVINNKSGDLLYVIYTSGSTGNPKGVMIQHRNVINFTNGLNDIINLEGMKKILLLTTVCFDISVLEMIVPLTLGLEVVIAARKLQTDMRNLLSYIEENQVDVLQVTPSRMQMLTLFSGWEDKLNSLKAILVGGESFPAALTEKLKALSETKIYNMYGPTETTIWSTVKPVIPGKKLTIGRPIANTHIYILNKNLDLAAAGEIGEIYIAGDGVARGYLNRPQLNSESFITNPYTGELMYYTGDLGRWLENGEIECLGRADFQVKVRGYRIEVGEIEHQLVKMDGITQAVVVYYKDSFENGYLCAYMTGKQEHSIEEIREHLLRFLPEYMIPSYFVFMDMMPLNNNGKVDRKKLPRPDAGKKQEKKDKGTDSILPDTIKDVWKTILGIAEIGDEDDFFVLGGNSLMAIRADVMFEEKKLPINSQLIYKLRTTKNIAAYLEDTQSIGTTEKVSESVYKKEPVDTDASKENSVVIKDIEPYNELFFESCFYNSLFAVLNYYKIDFYQVIKQYSLYYEYSVEDGLGRISADGDWKRDIMEILREVNVKCTCLSPRVKLTEQIKDAINRKHPVILWIDCYYESYRRDTYQKKHFPHTLTIWGYDEKSQIFNILEHEASDSLYYNKTQISFDELLEGYEGYLTHFASFGNYTFYEFYLDKENVFSVSSQELFEVSKWDSKIVKQFLSDLNNINFSELDINKIGWLLDGMNHVVNAKRIEICKLQHQQTMNDQVLYIEMQIVENWEAVRSFCARCYFKGKFTESIYGKLLDNVNKILELEAMYEELFLTK